MELSWKFKTDELERIASALSDKSAASDLGLGESSSLSGDDLESLLNFGGSDAHDNLDDSSILISDEPNEGDEESSSSTVIGKDKEGKKDDSDLKLAEDQSDVELAADKSGGSGSKRSDVADYDLELAEAEDLSDELQLSDELDFESDEALVLGEDGELALSDDDDLVLEDSEEGDLAIGASDSGIGLASPSDSGLSLEHESSAALELPEDDDMISLDDMSALPDDAATMQQDEEFLLSPSDEMLGDESSDSGSQVIALDDSGAFESESDVGVLDSAEPLLMTEEGEGLDVQLEPIESAAAVAGTLPSISAAEAPESDYSVWNLLALVFVVILLSVTGMLMADIVRNMWSWSGDTAAASGLANTIVDALGMK